MPAATPAAEIPTVAETGVVPPGGITVSQFPPEVVDALIVTAMGDPPLVIERGCVGGVAPLTVKLKGVGVAARVAGVVAGAVMV